VTRHSKRLSVTEFRLFCAFLSRKVSVAKASEYHDKYVLVFRYISSSKTVL